MHLYLFLQIIRLCSVCVIHFVSYELTHLITHIQKYMPFTLSLVLIQPQINRLYYPICKVFPNIIAHGKNIQLCKICTRQIFG